MTYREPAALSQEKPKEEPLANLAFDLTHMANQGDMTRSTCPFCNRQIGKLYPIGMENLARFCRPGNRYYRGLFFNLFRRRYCTIPGCHKHYLCKKCGTSWIVRLDEFYGNVPMLESP